MKNKEELNKKRGARLSQLRKEEGIKQELLAKKCNCSVQLLSGIENGKKVLTTDRARDFSKYFGVRMEYLLCEDDYKTNKERFERCKDKLNKQDEIFKRFCDEIGIFIEEVIKYKESKELSPLDDKLLNYEMLEDIYDINATHYILKHNNNKRIFSKLEYEEFKHKIVDYIIFEYEHAGKLFL